MMEIVAATLDDLEDCMACLEDSILGSVYFSDRVRTEVFFQEGFTRDEIFVVRDENGCAGFMRVDWQGAFSVFPLLRTISVKPERRNQGIGKLLLAYFEDVGFSCASKLFLFVSDKNLQAQRLYLRTGYCQVGAIPDLYKSGFTEFLMMKTR